MRRARGRGFTILEALVGIFILVMAAVFSAQMLGFTVRASATVRDETLGIELCQRKVREIVDWSGRRAENGALNFSGPWPDGRDGRPLEPPFAAAPDAENPRFVVQVLSGGLALESPARDMHGVVMARSARRIRVTATWGERPGTRPRQVSLVALVPEPPRRLSEIRISGAPGALGPGQQAVVKAEGVDAAGPIPDLVYRWDVIPLNGNATLQAAGTADQSSMAIVNSAPYTDGSRRCTGGRCRVRVRATCDGQEVARTFEIDLGTASKL